MFDNTAAYGGGVNIAHPPISICLIPTENPENRALLVRESIFHNNSASLQGGALRIRGNDVTVAMQFVTLSHNRAGMGVYVCG